MSIEDFKNDNLYVVYEEATKEVVETWPFGKRMAELGAETRNNSQGPDKFNSCSYTQWILVREKHNRHLAMVAECESRL